MNTVALIHDARHERHIKRLGKACVEAQAAGDRETAIACWEQMRQAIGERSPGQIGRMEARLGIRVRRKIKGLVMLAFCHGLVSAAMVATAFRLLRLGGL